MPPVKPLTAKYKPGNFCPVCGQPYFADYWTTGNVDPVFVHAMLEADGAPGQYVVHCCIADDEVFREWQKASDRALAAIEADKSAKRRLASDPEYRPRRGRS